MRERDAEWKYLVHEFHRSISWSGETTVADTCQAILKGEPTHSNHKEGEAGILGPHGDHAGHHPSRGMLGLKEAIFDEDNHFKGKDENLMHTQKHVNVLSATKISKKPGVWMSEEWSTIKNNLVPQGQWNRPYRSQRTVKIKFVPQGQSDRPHWSKRTAKIKIVPQGQWNRPYWCQRTAKNKLLPRSQQNRLQIRRSQKSKSTCLKVTEIDLYQVEHCKK